MLTRIFDGGRLEEIICTKYNFLQGKLEVSSKDSSKDLDQVS